MRAPFGMSLPSLGHAAPNLLKTAVAVAVALHSTAVTVALHTMVPVLAVAVYTTAVAVYHGILMMRLLLLMVLVAFVVAPVATGIWKRACVGIVAPKDVTHGPVPD